MFATAFRQQLAASIRPPLIRGGNLLAREPAARGHASIRPPLIRGGNFNQTQGIPADETASIRPPLIRGGNSSIPASQNEIARGFN